jgi:hypothetical protein
MKAPQVDPQAIARNYLAVWNDPNHTSRLATLEQHWSSDVCYADPLMHGETRSGISLMIDAARGQFPGHSFVLRGTPDGHGNMIRFSWDLVSSSGNKVAGGTDVVKLDPDGRLAEVIGFLD